MNLCQHRSQFEAFFQLKSAHIFPEKPPGQQILSLLKLLTF